MPSNIVKYTRHLYLYKLCKLTLSISFTCKNDKQVKSRLIWQQTDPTATPADQHTSNFYKIIQRFEVKDRLNLHKIGWKKKKKKQFERVSQCCVVWVYIQDSTVWLYMYELIPLICARASESSMSSPFTPPCKFKTKKKIKSPQIIAKFHFVNIIPSFKPIISLCFKDFFEGVLGIWMLTICSYSSWFCEPIDLDASQ